MKQAADASLVGADTRRAEDSRGTDTPRGGTASRAGRRPDSPMAAVARAASRSQTRTDSLAGAEGVDPVAARIALWDGQFAFRSAAVGR